MHRKGIPEKYYTYEQILNRAMKYCARYESSEWQVLNKMMQWGSFPADREKIIKVLKEQNFINDKRFAEAFVNDKFKFKGWGKKKIYMHLLAKGVSKSIIIQSVECINENIYYEKALALAQKKQASLKNEKNIQNKKMKIFRYLLQKGFSTEIAYKCLAHVSALKSEL